MYIKTCLVFFIMYPSEWDQGSDSYIYSSAYSIHQKISDLGKHGFEVVNVFPLKTKADAYGVTTCEEYIIIYKKPKF